MTEFNNLIPRYSGLKGRTIRGRKYRPSTGLSIIEVLIAAVLMLVVALGVIPLFVRSIASNATGQEYTHVANHARVHAEELYQLPFGSLDLTIPGGSTELVTDEFYSENNERWEVGTVPADPTDNARWFRTTTIKQFSAASLAKHAVDDVYLVDPADALDGNADPQIVQLKEIQVSIDSSRKTGPLGNKGQLTVWLLKSQ